MTVEIDADGKVHSGSGIVDVTYHSHGPLAGMIAGRYDSSFGGQAPELPWLSDMRAYDKQHPIQIDETYKLRSKYLLGD
jgi:hypothetical protein